MITSPPIRLRVALTGVSLLPFPSNVGAQGAAASGTARSVRFGS